MKTSNSKYCQALQLLLQLNYYREDNYLFSKIALFQVQKKIRTQYNIELLKIEQQRIQIQDKIISIFEHLQINDFWKSNLFQFSNKIYKNIKLYHHKLMTCSLKLSEMVDTNQFLQTFRQFTIDKLSQNKELSHILTQILMKIRQRFHKEIIIICNNFHLNKMIEHIRHDDINKYNKYLLLIKQGNASLFLQFHQYIIVEYQENVQNIINKNNNNKLNRFQLYGDILDLEDGCMCSSMYTMANSVSIHLNHKEEGFCQFIISKFYRIIKDFKNKNVHNEKQMSLFNEKYKNWSTKYKQNNKKTNKFNSLFKISKFSKKIDIDDKDETKSGSAIITTMQIKDNKFFTQTILNHTDLNITSFQTQFPHSNNNNLFKINRVENKKKSNTLKPLGESKQNNKEIIHQKIIEMKLQEQPLRLTKLLRIKRKRAFHAVRQQNVFGHIIKQNNLNKFSFLLP